jgi:hypothetical protein
MGSGKIPPSLVWLGVLIAIALLVSVILNFRIDKRLWGEITPSATAQAA